MTLTNTVVDPGLLLPLLPRLASLALRNTRAVLCEEEGDTVLQFTSPPPALSSRLSSLTLDYTVTIDLLQVNIHLLHYQCKVLTSTDEL